MELCRSSTLGVQNPKGFNHLRNLEVIVKLVKLVKLMEIKDRNVLEL